MQADIATRYRNVLEVAQDIWAVDPAVFVRGVEWFRFLGSPAFEQSRKEFQANREEGRESTLMSIPGERMNPYAKDPRERLLGRLGVHMTDEGVATVPLYGVMMKRPTDFGMSESGTSTDMFTDAMEIVAGLRDLRAVVLDVDSPGGSVAGVEDAAQAVRSLAGQFPVYAVSNEVMASAAYYVASQATEIYAPDTAITGSVGVYTARYDFTKRLKDQGVKVELVSAGKHKLDGHPATVMKDDERDRVQGRIDHFYNMFIDAVAEGRGISRDSALLLGDGTFHPSQQALELGFIDGIATLRKVVGAASRR